MNSKQVHGYLLNNNFEVVKKLSLEDKRRKYNTLIGYSIINELNYNLFLTNNKKNKFAGINFSYDGKKSQLKEFKLKDINEKFVQTLTIDNIFYLVSITSGTSNLNIYKFDGIDIPEPYTIVLNKDEFLGRDGSSKNLYDLFKIKSDGKYTSVETNKIDKDTPNAIEVVSKEKKLYLIDNQLVFTFDNYRNTTQVLTISLEDYSYNIKQINKPLFDSQIRSKKSNSYISNDMFFTIASTNDDMEVNISDYNSGVLIKQIKLNVEDSINFKNTPIIQEGGVYDNYRELESTKKFLRKITSGDLGISAYKNKNEYLITIGSEKQIPRGGGMMMPMGGFAGIPIATVGSANVFFNPTYFAYNSYSSTKSTRIDCLYNLNFEHLKGDITDNLFDRIKNFEEDSPKIKVRKPLSNNKGYKRVKDSSNITDSRKGETIFKYKDYFVLGNYIEKSKTYILRKFEED